MATAVGDTVLGKRDIMQELGARDFRMQGGKMYVEVSVPDPHLPIPTSEPKVSGSPVCPNTCEEDEFMVKRRWCCYSAYVKRSDKTIDVNMEARFARSKYHHFRAAFMQVSFLMSVGVLVLACAAAIRSHWARVGTLVGVISPIYAACGALSRWQQDQYLSMSGTFPEQLLVLIFCLQTAAIVFAEWARSEMDYGLLCMHVGYIYNFTPLKPGYMHAITIPLGVVPFAVLTIGNILQVNDDNSDPTHEDGPCKTTHKVHRLVTSMLEPTAILLYQIIVTFRRDESLRIDVLTSQDLSSQRKRLELEQTKNHDILSSMVPRQLISSFKARGHIEPQCYPDVTVIFIEICNLHKVCVYLSPSSLVEMLNIIYHEFDRLSDLLYVYKVETVGEVYMAVVGAPECIVNHADVAAHFGLAAQQSMLYMQTKLNDIMSKIQQGHVENIGNSPHPNVVDEQQAVRRTPSGQNSNIGVQIRVGLNSGLIRAGVVGLACPRFKLFGDTVNTASRMESTCEAGKIQVSASTRQILTEGMFVLQERGYIQVKGKGRMHTHYLLGYANDHHLLHPRKVLIEKATHLTPAVTSESTNWSEVQRSASLFSDADPLRLGAQGLRAGLGRPDKKTTEGSRAHGQDALQKELTCHQKPSLCDRLDQLLLLVPASPALSQRLAELRQDQLRYDSVNLERQLAMAWNLALFLLLTLCFASLVERMWHQTGRSMAGFREVVIIRSLGNNFCGLAYLLALACISPTRRLGQRLTLAMLLAQCIALLAMSAFNRDGGDESDIIVVVTMYIAYVLFNTLCTLCQRLGVCLFAVCGYMSISGFQCGLDQFLNTVNNAAFLGIFVLSMACSLRLQEHLQHVSSFKHRCAENSLESIKEAKQEYAQLLTNMLPSHVVDQVRQGVSPIAELHSCVTIVATDIKGFTKFAASVTPGFLVSVLNGMYSAFDEIIAKWELYKVEIIGDAYLISAGCPAVETTTVVDASEWATRAVEVALAMQRTLPTVCNEESVQMRVGIHTGSVVAGVVGKKGPRYHLTGKDVNYAELMESTGVPGHVQVSDATHRTLEDGGRRYQYEERQIQIDDDDTLHRTWLVTGGNSYEAATIQRRLMLARRKRQPSLLRCIAGAALPERH